MHISVALIDFHKRHVSPELVAFTFYKGIFVQKQPPKGVLPKNVLTIVDNPMILLKIFAEFYKNNCEGAPSS